MQWKGCLRINTVGKEDILPPGQISICRYSYDLFGLRITASDMENGDSHPELHGKLYPIHDIKLTWIGADICVIQTMPALKGESR